MRRVGLEIPKRTRPYGFAFTEYPDSQLAWLRTRWTMSQHSSRANLAAIYYTLLQARRCPLRARRRAQGKRQREQS
eukprot:12412105-Karenia_brevis.AAC.1